MSRRVRKSFELSEEMDKVLRQLAVLYGTQTIAVVVALDRLAKAELPGYRGMDEEPDEGKE